MDLSVYVITADVPELDRDHLVVAQEAIAGGATVIQFREKTRNTREALEIASKLRLMTKTAGISLIINDRVDIALAVGADGVHLGQEDMPVALAKKIVSKGMVIGVSVTNLIEAIQAEKEGADYLGVGPIYPTPSKKDTAEPIGLDGLKMIRAQTSTPIVAIGGITCENAAEVIKAGADGIAVISTVTNAPDMREATRILRQKVVGDQGE